MKCVCLIFALFAVQHAVADASLTVSAEEHKANPIRKVVTMLQKIQKKVEAEGDKETEMFGKFMCYCKTSSNDLESSISAAETKIPQVKSSIEGAEGEKVQLDSDLVRHKADRAAAKEAMDKATALRKKESSTYFGVKAEADANIGATKKAVASLEKGVMGSFLQTQAAASLRNFVQNTEMSEAAREEVLSFLSSNVEDSEDAPSSGEITGILKTLGERMEKDLAEATAIETASVKDYNDLSASKTKETEACTGAIEDKTVRVGEVAVSIVNMKEDLDDTEAALVEDNKFLAELSKTCATKQKEWDEVVAARAEEMVALAETIKLLNDDDALELFKKTLPGTASASFVQIAVTSSLSSKRALVEIHAAQRSSKIAHPKLDLIALALHGKAVDFKKVVRMIDEMADVLKREQVDDDDKLDYCNTQIDSLDDKKKQNELSISDSEKAIADAKEAIETLTGEIAALTKGIKALDKSVAEASAQRKDEHAEVTELLAQNAAAKDLIGFAKNRLNKFYNPKLYKAAPKRELSAEDRIVVNNGGTAPPTPAPGGIAGTGITSLVQVSVHTQIKRDAPPPAPEAPGPFKKKGEESSGVIAMMDLLINDLDKETQIAEAEEKDAQADYEVMLRDSKEKRAADSQSLSEKGAAKADAESALQDHTDDSKVSTQQLQAVLGILTTTHLTCDWLVENYDVRKEARGDEIDSLTKAKAVLSGADFSLLQYRSSARQLRGGRA